MTCISKNDLNKHILYKHSNEKPFKCEFCDKYRAKTLSDLNKHVQLKHDDAEEYQCNDCDEFKTKNLNLMKKHMMKFHLNQAKLSYLYKCHECDKTYSYGSTLSTHLKTVHNYKWPSGHSRFRYKLDNDGFYRLQTLRYESVELVEQINREKEEKTKLAEVEQQQQQLQHINYATANLISDDRENDFDDEDENMLMQLEEEEEEEDEEEEDDETCEEMDEDNINFEFNESNQQQAFSSTSFKNSNNFKEYLIKRLIDDENKAITKNRPG